MAQTEQKLFSLTVNTTK